MKKTRGKMSEVEEDVTPPLELLDKNEVPLFTFPDAVVENLRLMISRLCRNAPFPSRLSLVSALRGEGTTYISRALGVTMANDLDVTVCVVELNWWWPSDLSINAQGKGLADVLKGDISLEEALIPTGNPNLTLLPAGRLPIDKRPVFARSNTLEELIEELSGKYDHLILDLPAVMATNDAISLASLGNACCLVVRQGVTSIENVRLTLDDLDHLPVVGIVMNQVKLATPSFLLKFIPQQ